MTHAYILTTIRDDGEAFTTKFEGYLAESAADAAFRECSGPQNKRHMVYAQLKHVNDRRGEVRSQWPKFDPNSTTYYTPSAPQAVAGLLVEVTRQKFRDKGWSVAPQTDDSWMVVHNKLIKASNFDIENAAWAWIAQQCKYQEENA